MKMLAKRQYLEDALRTVIQDAHITVQPNERDALQRWTGGPRFIGDMLTESICMTQALFSWYKTETDACEDLTTEFFLDFFSLAVRGEEKIRDNQGDCESEKERILEAMNDYVARIRGSSSAEELSRLIVEVVLARQRGQKTASRLGWYSGVPRTIVGYLSAAHTVMPKVTIEDLLGDLLIQHKSELSAMEDGAWTPSVPFKRAVIAALKACAKTNIQPWETKIDQQPLW